MTTRIVDLSLRLTDNMPAHKLFQRPMIIPHMTHENTKSFGLGVPGDPMSFATVYMGMLDHIGTHVDAFYHVNPAGLTVDKMPLEIFIGKAVCFDLRHIPDLADIDVKDMEEAEKKASVKVDGHIVLLNTGLHERWYPKPEVVWKNPGITAAATHWLADRGRDRKIAHYEWLVNLDQLVGKGEFQFSGVPIALGDGSGAPVRAYAVLN